MPSRKSNNTARKTPKSTESKKERQIKVNRNPDNLHYRQEGESPLQGINYDNDSWDNVIDVSPIQQAYANLQRMRQLDLPAIVPRLNMEMPDYQNEESESESESMSDIATRVIRSRNREKLPEGERRRFNNMMKFLISAVKGYSFLYKFDQMQHDSLFVEEKIVEVYNQLIKVLNKLSSRSAKKIYLMMVFNDFNPSLNQFIMDKAKKTRAQKDYIKLIQKYAPLIINQAKNILRAVVKNALKDSIISQEARKRGFYGKHQEKRREKFEQYFKNFIQQLKKGEIKPIVKKKNVLNQALYLP